jgi:hypothetical protein
MKVVGKPLPSLSLTGPNGENIPLRLQLDENNDAVIGNQMFLGFIEGFTNIFSIISI